MGAPRVIAHRGDSAARPENTLGAFASALEAGADIVELDVQLTRDREVVVLHDPTVDRTTNGQGAVAELTLQELRALSAGYPAVFGASFSGERVPTLAEALHFLRGRARVVIEIKPEAGGGPIEDGVEARTLAEVHRAGVAREVALVSFDNTILQRCRTLDPRVARGHLFYRVSPAELLAAAAAVEADIVLPEKGLLTPELRAQLRDAGLHVATWLVDDPAELPALLEYDLFGIGTNRPGTLLDALASA